jgi:hypothetical protein
VSFLRDPFDDDVAPVPAGPTLPGEGATGDDDPMFALVCDATLDCESELRAYLYIISPFAFKVSISMSWSASGILSRLLFSAMGPSVGWRDVAAPCTNAPSAR